MYNPWLNSGLVGSPTVQRDALPPAAPAAPVAPVLVAVPGIP